MATAMIYDTLKLAEQLEHEAGFDAARAKAMARILAENAGGNLVTREDLGGTKGELQTAIHAVRGELHAVQGDVQALKGDVQALKGDVQALKGDVQALKGDVQGLKGDVQGLKGDVRVLFWMSGTTLAGVASLLGIAITIALHLMRLE
ncbi:MAG TPA: hypothetical protein VN735_08970 [Steroidobacteraceae bacterium]|nr:hypothetical protein [Steroidobacteraceae bacterium]